MVRWQFSIRRLLFILAAFGVGIQWLRLCSQGEWEYAEMLILAAGIPFVAAIGMGRSIDGRSLTLILIVCVVAWCFLASWLTVVVTEALRIADTTGTHSHLSGLILLTICVFLMPMSYGALICLWSAWSAAWSDRRANHR